MPSLTGKRTTLRRGGYPTRAAATAALTHVLECERAGVWLDDTQTVADFLTTCAGHRRTRRARSRSN